MAEAESEKGLPMTSKWDPEKLAAETAALEELNRKPFFFSAFGYIQRTGPGLLQSAMTLGAGSAAASVMAGASFGYKLLWVQPVAMFLGVCMLAALANITLTTKERPYRSFGREMSYVLTFLWAFGTIAASVIWHFPQYGLVAGAARDLADLFGGTVWNTPAAGEDPALTSTGLAVSWGVGALILGLNIFTVWNYGSGARGIKMYEWFLRGVIGLIILAFAIVVGANAANIDWAELGKGFIGWYGIPKGEASLTLVLGMLGAAVGINMTFLYPYSLLAKGWGDAHRRLARWDLGMSMFLPFVLVTSLVMVGMTVSGVYKAPGAGEVETVVTGLKPIDAAQSLTGIMGNYAGRLIFDLGLIGMACGAISTHMVVCGFTLCEMFGLKYTRWRFRIFALAPAVGILGVVTSTPIWFPIFASAICFTMLPIAYLMFFVLANNRTLVKDSMGRGLGREIFNVILLLALIVASIGSAIKLKSNVYDKLKGVDIYAAVKGYFQPAAEPADKKESPADEASS